MVGMEAAGQFLPKGILGGSTRTYNTEEAVGAPSSGSIASPFRRSDREGGGGVVVVVGVIIAVSSCLLMMMMMAMIAMTT